MKAKLRGSFALIDADGADVPIAGQKERALVAILLLSSDQQRSRKWLQSTLWSERFQEQAAASLRRALANLRKVVAETGIDIIADRQSVRIVGDVELDWGNIDQGALLEDIHVKDDAYAGWLRKLRFKEDGVIAKLDENILIDVPREKIVITANLSDPSPELRFLTRTLTDAFAEHLKSQGPVEVTLLDAGEVAESAKGNVLWRVDISSVLINHRWRVHVGAVRETPKRHLWSGKLQLAFDIEKILEGYDIVDFVGRSVASIQKNDRSAQGVYLNLLAASQKIFLGDRDELELADRVLAGLEIEDPEGVARAWRAFVGLTRILEHGVVSDDDVSSAIQFATNVDRGGTTNPLSTALSAQVAMKIGRDNDRGNHLARKAHEINDANPYALHAMSQASVLRGDFLSGYKFAVNGRKASASLPHSYCWGMQACLAALGIGKRGEAYELARDAHAKMPSYRPALRYLAALGLLSNKTDEARQWCDRLSMLEPDFEPALLISDAYPLDTFRQLGLQDELASVWQP